jgi:hypothetical protein
VIDGNVIKGTIRRDDTTAGHGISEAASFDYVIVNNAAISGRPSARRPAVDSSVNVFR